jgi:chemotaxis signal transduction protein
MLTDLISAQPGALAAFVDGAGRVVAASDERFAPGAEFPLAADGSIVEYEGCRYACARVQAHGYREFKVQDGYRNGVSAVVAVRLGLAQGAARTPLEALPAPSAVVESGAIDIAAFRLGDHCFALRASAVLDAVPAAHLVRVRQAAPDVLGLLDLQGAGGPMAIEVVDGRGLTGQHDPVSTDELLRGVVIVLQQDGRGRAWGLWVDDLLWVAEFEEARLQPPPPALKVHAPLVEALISLDDGSSGGLARGPLVKLLSAERLLASRRAPLARAAE